MSVNSSQPAKYSGSTGNFHRQLAVMWDEAGARRGLWDGGKVVLVPWQFC